MDKWKSILLLLLCLASCIFPRDPENSYEEARSEKLLIGVVENPPYTKIEDSVFSGSEIEMLREFAEKDSLRIFFQKGSESELIRQLENYDLHIVAGGFTKKAIWKKKVGMTAPYDKEHVFLIPKGENQLLKQLEHYIFQKKKGM